MKVMVYRHALRDTPNGKLVCKRHLPIRQTILWLGPLVVLIQRRSG